MPEEDLPPAPNVDPRWRWVWRAWHRLSPDRPFHGGGMGPSVPGNIPWWQIRLWARDHDMTAGQRHVLDICIQRMDETYRTWSTERQKQEQQQQGNR